MRFLYRRSSTQDRQQGRYKNCKISSRSDPNHNVDVRELRKVAATLKIEGRQRMSKMELAEEIDKRFAAARIWIAMSARRKLKKRNDNFDNTRITNNLDEETGEYLDPITMDTLESPIFIYKINANKEIHYSLLSLHQYLFTSKVFKDPVTGVSYTEANLREMDALAHQHQLALPNLLLSSRSKEPETVKQRRDIIAALERICGNYIEQFRQIIQLEHPFSDYRVGAQAFNSVLNFEFKNYLRQLRLIDRESADIAIKQWCEFLAGPPNRPNPNPFNFLEPIVNWLRSI